MAKHWKKPESKSCGICSAIFTKNGNTTDYRWEITKNCPSCRKKKASNRDKTDHHNGHFIHPIIDKFIYG